MNVSAGAWARLVSAGGARHHEPDAVLLRQGDPATHVLMLVIGRVKVLRMSPDGDVLVLAVRGPGEILGDISVLGGEGRSASVIAVDPCETRYLPADRFLARLRAQGIVATGRRRITITDVGRLRTLAESGHGNV
jgi:CRP-like cAMP-binding protein